MKAHNVTIRVHIYHIYIVYINVFVGVVLILNTDEGMSTLVLKLVSTTQPTLHGKENAYSNIVVCSVKSPSMQKFSMASKTWRENRLVL